VLAGEGIKKFLNFFIFVFNYPRIWSKIWRFSAPGGDVEMLRNSTRTSGAG